MADDEIGVRLSLKDRAKFSSEAARARRDIDALGNSAGTVGSRGRLASGGLAVMRTGITGIITVAKAGAVALGGLATGLAIAGGKSIQLAMDAGETESKFNTVFKGMEQQVGSFVDTMNADYGIPTKELQDAASTFGVFGKSAGIAKDELAPFSTDLTQAGLDLASFYNADPGEVFENLRSGLAGEAEPMRKFGIFMSDASLNAFMLKEGMSGVFSELSEGEKVAVRQQFIMSSLGDAQGDLDRTSGGLANQWRGLKGRGQELLTVIGQGLLPVATQFVSFLNNRMSPVINNLTEGMPHLATGFERAFKTGSWEGVSMALSSMGMGIGDLVPKVERLAQVGGAFGGRGGGFVQGINALKEEFPGLKDVIQTVQSVVGDLVTIWKVGLQPAFSDAAAIIPDVLQPLRLVDNVIGFIADNAAILSPLITGLTVAWAAHKAMVFGLGVIEKGALAIRIGMAIATGNLTVVEGLATAATGGLAGAQSMLNAVLLMNPIGLVVLAIAALVAGFVIAWKKSETFRNVVTGVWDSVKNAFGVAVQWVKDRWNGIVGFFETAPQKLAAAARGLWDGVKDSFRAAINWIIEKWNALDFTLPSINAFGKEIGGATIGVPDIPMLAKGGTTTRGGVTWVGERGPEPVILPPAASVVPLPTNASDLHALMEGGGGGPQVIQLVVGSRVLAEVLLDEVGDQQARR